jgi:RimJ/RimL family protein N-acetyltransferase
MFYHASIYSKLLCLSPMLALHAETMFPILSDRRLYVFTGDEPPESEMALEERYRKLESRKSPDESQLWLNWMVSLREDGTSIGYLQATVSEFHADIAWVIGAKWQGSGYASEAAIILVKLLRENEVKVVRACIKPTHLASQRVASNAGLSKSNVIEDGEDVWLL